MSEGMMHFVMFFGLLGVAAVLAWSADFARRSDDPTDETPLWRDDFTCHQ